MGREGAAGIGSISNPITITPSPSPPPVPASEEMEGMEREVIGWEGMGWEGMGRDGDGKGRGSGHRVDFQSSPPVPSRG